VRLVSELAVAGCCLGGIVAATAQDFPSAALAKAPPNLPPFSSLCIAADAVGFNWSGGSWVFARFTPEKFIVRKFSENAFLRPRESGDKSLGACAGNWEAAVRNQTFVDAGNAGFAALPGCYRISEFGNDSQPLAAICSEVFAKIDGSSEFSFVSIQCDWGGLTFRPDGQFIRRNVSQDLRTTKELDARAKSTPEKFDDIPGGYKDSLFVSHGSCSTIK
jgi:hypothetical protein